jgi:hypothetical protein
LFADPQEPFVDDGTAHDVPVQDVPEVHDAVTVFVSNVKRPLTRAKVVVPYERGREMEDEVVAVENITPFCLTCNDKALLVDHDTSVVHEEALEAIEHERGVGENDPEAPGGGKGSIVTDTGAEQLAVVPPPVPPQDHTHVLGTVSDVETFFVTEVARPNVQRPVEGEFTLGTLLAAPQDPLTLESLLALHEAVAPPFVPLHVHDHGPVPESSDGIPAEQKLVVGADTNDPPFEVPHTPTIGVGAIVLLALHEAVAPPFVPLHVHDHGPVPESTEALPAEQRLEDGAEEKELPFDEPQTPAVADGGADVPPPPPPPPELIALLALQVSVVPPLVPLQLHDHGPAPETTEVTPLRQRLVYGVLVND